MEARAASLVNRVWAGGGRRDALALLGWAALIALACGWGELLNGEGSTILLGAPPLSGRFNPGLQPQALVPLAVGAAIVVAAPRLASSLGWRGLLLATFAGAWAWAGALDLLDGGYWLTVPVLKPDEFLRDVPLVGSPGVFLSHFTQHTQLYVNHVQTHPPGTLLALWGLDRIGLGGAMPAALLMVSGGAAAMPAALVAMREVAGEHRARAAAPFLVLAPVAIWIATSADALYAGVAGWGVALLVLATGCNGRRSDALALGGGLLLGLALMFSYGLVLAWAIPAIVAVRRRRPRPLAIAVLGPVVVLATFAAAGFWWLDGYTAARDSYYDGVAASRPYPFFFVSNLAAFAVALGPAVCVGLTRLRDRAAWPLVGGGLAAVAIADLSGMSKGEVERIWLPFAPFVMLAAPGLPARRCSRRLSRCSCARPGRPPRLADRVPADAGLRRWSQWGDRAAAGAAAGRRGPRRRRHDAAGGTRCRNPRRRGRGRGVRRARRRRARRRRRRGAAAGGGSPADGAAGEARSAQAGNLRCQQPDPPRGNRQPGRGGAGGGRHEDGRPEHRLRLRARGRLGEGRGGADDGRGGHLR